MVLDKKTLWKFIKINTNESIYIRVVESFGFDSPHSIARYEHPGTNGGSIKNLGRLTETGVLNVTLVGEDLVDISNQYMLLKKIKDNGDPVRLVSPVQISETGRYQIEGLSGSIDPGATQHSIITISLVEDREFNEKINSEILVASEPKEQYLEVYIARTGQQQL